VGVGDKGILLILIVSKNCNLKLNNN